MKEVKQYKCEYCGTLYADKECVRRLREAARGSV